MHPLGKMFFWVNFKRELQHLVPHSAVRWKQRWQFIEKVLTVLFAAKISYHIIFFLSKNGSDMPNTLLGHWPFVIDRPRRAACVHTSVRKMVKSKCVEI